MNIHISNECSNVATGGVLEKTILEGALSGLR